MLLNVKMGRGKKQGLLDHFVLASQIVATCSILP